MSNIDLKYFRIFINKEGRICPHKEFWWTAYGFLKKGYERRQVENDYMIKKNLNKYVEEVSYPPKPKNTNYKGLKVNDKLLKYQLEKQLAWLKKLDDEEITDQFCGYLSKLKINDWYTISKKKRRSKDLKELIGDIGSNRKTTKRASNLLKKSRMLTKYRNK